MLQFLRKIPDMKLERKWKNNKKKRKKEKEGRKKLLPSS